MATHDDLLKPALEAGSTVHPAVYSTTAGFLTAFFGGPFAAVALTALNAWRLRRLAKDAGFLVAAAVVSAASIALLHRPDLLGLPDPEFNRNVQRLLQRALALALFGAGYLLHRRYFRNMELMGLTAPNPWPAGLACVLFGVIVTATLTWLLNS